MARLNNIHLRYATCHALAQRGFLRRRSAIARADPKADSGPPSDHTQISAAYRRYKLTIIFSPKTVMWRTRRRDPVAHLCGYARLGSACDIRKEGVGSTP